MKFTIPIRLPSLTNKRMHPGEIMRLKANQRSNTHLSMIGKQPEIPPPPLTVTLTRIGPRRLDDDNLAAAFKHVRDQIADEIGIDDGSPMYKWVYEQRIVTTRLMRHFYQYSVEVEIITRADAEEVNNADAQP